MDLNSVIPWLDHGISSGSLSNSNRDRVEMPPEETPGSSPGVTRVLLGLETTTKQGSSGTQEGKDPGAPFMEGI